MSIRRNPLGLVLVVLHAMGIIVGIYAIMTLWGWVPGFKSLFGDNLIDCEKFTKQILFVFVPIGIALFCNQIVLDDNVVCKALTGIKLRIKLLLLTNFE